MRNYLLIWLSFVCFCIFAQQPPTYFPDAPSTPTKKEKVKIVRTDSLLYQTQELGKYRKLIGHVQLAHENANMFCDSAILDIDANYVMAFGRIHINDADTVDVWGDFLEYFGDQKLARLTGNTVMRDKTSVLTAPEFLYNTKTQVGNFTGNGIMVKDSTKLTSESGYYYHKTKEAIFYGHVVYNDRKNTMYADSMRYNTETEFVYFISKTKIIDKDSSIIETSSGYYDTKNEKAHFGKGTEINKESTTIRGDQIEYDSKLKQAHAQGNVMFRDTSEDIILLSNRSFYSEDSSFIQATDDPLLMAIDKDENDTLFLSADTLISYKVPMPPDSTGKIDSFRITYAYHHVKMIQRDISAVGDSLYYSTEDSTFHIYNSPLLWMDSTQVFGDSIHVILKNKKIDHLSIFGNGFIVQLMDSTIYNQVKGKSIEGFVEKEKLRQVDVDGNAESIYFVQDDNKAYAGVNQSESGNISLFFDKDDIQSIKLTTGPSAIFTPMKQISPESTRLEGFRWDWEKKPKSRWEVIRGKAQYDKFILDEENKRPKVEQVKTEELKQEETPIENNEQQ